MVRVLKYGLDGVIPRRLSPKQASAKTTALKVGPSLHALYEEDWTRR
jgi:hypothetical protein